MESSSHPPHGSGRPRPIRDGLVVGAIAYAAVAVFYGVFDILAGRGLFYTVNMLGRALVRGLRDTGVLLYPVELDPTAMLWYNALHLVAALSIGIVVVWLVGRAYRAPDRLGALRLVLFGGFIVTVLAVGWLSAPIRPVLPWWSIVTANVLAAATAGLWILRRHPGTARRLLGAAPSASRAPEAT